MTDWTPERRRRLKPKAPPTKVLLVMDPRLFWIRDAKGKLTDQVSDSMLQQAAKLYEKVAVFPARGMQQMPMLREAVDRLQLYHIEIIEDEGLSSFAQVVSKLRQLILSLGGEIKQVSNPREISHLNIERFVLSPHIIIARQDDWQKAGLELDKPKSFVDLTKDRKGRSFW